MAKQRRTQPEEEEAGIEHKSQDRGKKHELKHILLLQTPIKEQAKHTKGDCDKKRKQVRKVIVQKHEQYQRQ